MDATVKYFISQNRHITFAAWLVYLAGQFQLMLHCTWKCPSKMEGVTIIIIGLKCTCTVVNVTKEVNQRFSVGRKRKTSSYNDQSWQIYLKRHFIETTQSRVQNYRKNFPWRQKVCITSSYLIRTTLLVPYTEA